MLRTAADLWDKLTGLKVPALIPVGLTILSLYLAYKVYRRKSGACIRGVFTPCQSRDCNDEFVSEVVLENLKDRSVSIFGIYLRVGYNNYLVIEEFDDVPLTLRPFETYVKSFGPIEFYAVNDSRIGVNNLLFGRRNVKKALFLATSDGKYKVKSRIPRWSPRYDWFSNYLTAVIQPVRSMHLESSVGGNIKFVVDFVKEDGSVEPIHVPGDYERQVFKNFRITRESLANKASLEQFLQKQREDGKLVCKDFTVYDLESWRATAHEFYRGKTLQAKPYGLFHYLVVGRLFTIYENRQMKRKNVRLSQARQRPKPSTIPVNDGPNGEKGVIELKEVTGNNSEQPS